MSLTLKAIFTVWILIGLNNQIAAQHNNCYNDWLKKFTDKKAEAVEDGTYSDVIISFRKPGHTICCTGTAKVKDGKVESFFTEEENGELTTVKREWESDLKNITISNGMSSTMVAKGNELIVLFWPKKLKQTTHVHDKSCGDH